MCSITVNLATGATLILDPVNLGSVDVPTDTITANNDTPDYVSIRIKSYVEKFVKVFNNSTTDHVSYVFTVNWTEPREGKGFVFNFQPNIIMGTEALFQLIDNKPDQVICDGDSHVCYSKYLYNGEETKRGGDVQTQAGDDYRLLTAYTTKHGQYSQTKCIEMELCDSITNSRVFKFTVGKGVTYLTGVQFVLHLKKTLVLSPSPDPTSGAINTVTDGWPDPWSTHPALKQELKQFITASLINDSKIVLITSGGTKVALEKKAVRYITNFSTGKRGATSAEYFLKKGYSVIYLGSKDSLKPFHQKMHSMAAKGALLDAADSSGQVDVTEYTAHRDKLMLLEFETLSEYFNMLQGVCPMIHLPGHNAMVYLAAAVSDFYKPFTDLPDEKMSSTESTCCIDLKPVPKLIPELKKSWCPTAFVVTFKLETEQDKLMTTSQQALDKYGHQAVVGNVLETRYSEVHLLMSDGYAETIALTDDDIGKGTEIESFIVDKLINKHTEYSHDAA